MRGLQVVAVKAPGFGDNRKKLSSGTSRISNYASIINNLSSQDIAILTGAEVISEELGLKLRRSI